MLLSFLLLAAQSETLTNAQRLEQCVEAVDARDYAAVAQKCRTEGVEVNIWGTDDPFSDQNCLETMKAGERWAKLRGTPYVLSGAAKDDFYSKLDLCRNPPKREETPTRDVPQIWD